MGASGAIELACALLASGCAGRGVDCLVGPSCPDGTECGVDGTCRPATAQAARFARYLALAPRDWGFTTRAHPRDRSPDRDTLLLGGAEGAAIYLAFGPVPEDAEIVGAVLALHVLRTDFHSGLSVTVALCAIALWVVGSDAIIRLARSFA